jgi:hypothetical protein
MMVKDGLKDMEGSGESDLGYYYTALNWMNLGKPR